MSDGGLMRAVVVEQFGGPEVLRVKSLPVPAPGPKQVLVRVHAAGVNPVDTYVRAGTYAMKPPLPYTPGGDGAGVVEAVGAEVKSVRAGDRVYVGGTAGGNLVGLYATHAVCNESQVHPLPQSVTFEQGAAVNVAYVTAHRAMFDRGGAKPGDTVLIHGASGGVGIAAVQLAAAAGCVVIGTAGSDEGLRLVRAHGARHAFSHKAPNYLDEIHAVTGGRGVDVTVEMLANVNLEHDLKLAAPHGRVVIVGSRGRIEIAPRDTMGKEVDVRGMQMWGGGEAPVNRAHAAIVAGLANGTLRPVVGTVLPLEDAPKAHEQIMAGGAAGKIVLRC
jgi:NADPH2:quinone reductase